MPPDSEDEEKWLAEGIAGIQHHAFYMHRALVRPHSPFQPNWNCNLKLVAASHLNPISLPFPGFQWSQGRAQVLGADAIGAADLTSLASQILRALYVRLPIFPCVNATCVFVKFCCWWVTVSAIGKIWGRSMNWGRWRCSSGRRRRVAISPLLIYMSSFSMRATSCPDCNVN